MGVLHKVSTKIKEIWSDIDHRFIQDSRGNLKVAINIESVYSSIDNILRTRRGERVMLPEFGSNLMDAVFEPLNDTILKFLSRDLKETIERWDDRVIVNEVQIFQDPDYSSISLTVLFIIKGYTNIFKYETQVRGEV